jgi:hypothetical protein
MRAVGWRTYGAQSQISRKVEAACRSVGLAAPRFATASARQVWELLRDTVRPRGALISILRITDASKDHELDPSSLFPGRGSSW